MLLEKDGLLSDRHMSAAQKLLKRSIPRSTGVSVDSLLPESKRVRISY